MLKSDGILKPTINCAANGAKLLLRWIWVKKMIHNKLVDPVEKFHLRYGYFFKGGGMPQSAIVCWDFSIIKITVT